VTLNALAPRFVRIAWHDVIFHQAPHHVPAQPDAGRRFESFAGVELLPHDMAGTKRPNQKGGERECKSFESGHGNLPGKAQRNFTAELQLRVAVMPKKATVEIRPLHVLTAGH
jgi:hypothetical protein